NEPLPSVHDSRRGVDPVAPALRDAGICPAPRLDHGADVPGGLPGRERTLGRSLRVGPHGVRVAAWVVAAWTGWPGDHRDHAAGDVGARALVGRAVRSSRAGSIGGRGVMRTVVLLLVMAMARPAAAEHVYLREADAPRAMYPASTTSTRKILELSDAEVD